MRFSSIDEGPELGGVEDSDRDTCTPTRNFQPHVPVAQSTVEADRVKVKAVEDE